MKKILFSAIWLCTFASTANALVIYDIQNGSLMGASGIEINGDIYSVTFEDSCSSAYAGCDELLFDFTTEQDAVAALDALFDQVFVDDVIVGGVEYDFDSFPELAQSCDRLGFCEIWVPYLDLGNDRVQSAWYVNSSGNDYVGSTTHNGYYTYGDGRDFMAFTNFELTSAPEPTTLALLGLGLVGLGFARKKKVAQSIKLKGTEGLNFDQSLSGCQYQLKFNISKGVAMPK